MDYLYDVSFGTTTIYPKKIPFPRITTLSDFDVNKKEANKILCEELKMVKAENQHLRFLNIKLHGALSKSVRGSNVVVDESSEHHHHHEHRRSSHGSKTGGGAGRKEKETPDSYICSISQDIMKDPVICSDGHTYEKEFIEKWLKNNNTSPLTNKILENKNLIPNFALKKAIDEYIS